MQVDNEGNTCSFISSAVKRQNDKKRKKIERLRLASSKPKRDNDYVEKKKYKKAIPYSIHVQWQYCEQDSLTPCYDDEAIDYQIVFLLWQKVQ